MFATIALFISCRQASKYPKKLASNGCPLFSRSTELNWGPTMPAAFHATWEYPQISWNIDGKIHTATRSKPYCPDLNKPTACKLVIRKHGLRHSEYCRSNDRENFFFFFFFFFFLFFFFFSFRYPDNYELNLTGG